MSYTPTVWENNDLVTPVRMNKIEQGVKEASEKESGVTMEQVNAAIQEALGNIETALSEI